MAMLAAVQHNDCKTMYVAWTACEQMMLQMGLLLVLKYCNVHCNFTHRPTCVNQTVKCKLFPDNGGAFEQAKMAKYQPRTRHINAAWHHFRPYVANGLIQVHSIRTDWQLGDTFTKQVSNEDFVKFCKLIFGW
jgi:hypothetical protein